MNLEHFLSRLNKVKHEPAGIKAECPRHDDSQPSLSINEGGASRILLTCHGGCTSEHVVESMGLTMADLMGEATSNRPQAIEKSYVYPAADGALLYHIDRYGPKKDFRIRPMRIPPEGRLLYQPPAIEWARLNGKTVYVVEGEKDADTLAALGIPATTNPFGAGKWLDHFSAMLAGCDVCVIADADDPGKAHARQVFASVKPHAANIRLTVTRAGKDVTDMLSRLHVDDLEPLSEVEQIARLASEFTPTRVR